MTGIQSIRSQNPNSIGIPVIRNALRDLKIPALFNLVENRIAHSRVDPILSGEKRDVLGYIKISVNQIVRLPKITQVFYRHSTHPG